MKDTNLQACFFPAHGFIRVDKSDDPESTDALVGRLYK
jgi:hypothetical protein